MDDAKSGRKEPNEREITYQVGWKRGKIRAKEEERSGLSSPEASEDGTRLMQFLWRPLPGLSAKWLPALLWTVPVVSFAVTYALVTALMRAH